MVDLKHFKTVLAEVKAALKPIENAHKSGGILDEDFAESTRHIIRLFRMAVESDLSGAYFLMDKTPENEKFKVFVYSDPHALEFQLDVFNKHQAHLDDERYTRMNFFKLQKLNGNAWFNPLNYEITEKGALIFHSSPQNI